ncbi:MAG: transglutaminase-like domain-containing protein [Candidatus Micrarchaeota archaeon]
MKRALLLLLLISISFCTPFGNATVAIERQWVLTGEPTEINFTGMLVLNNPNQQVLEAVADQPLELRSEGDKIFVVYNGPFDGNMSYKAHAVVRIDYNTNITRDEPLPTEPIVGTDLVKWDDSIHAAALGAADSQSSLKTIAAVSNWVSNYLTYDLSYFGLSKSAIETMQEKRGVCVEHTHLLIAMLNSLGFKTRYVGGYAMSTEWQPHSWAEVYIDNQWVPVDATFREAGIMDSNHVALSYGNDASDIYEKVMTYRDTKINADTQLTVLDESENAKGIETTAAFDTGTNTATVLISNTRSDYVFGSYLLLVPPEYGGEKRQVLLLQPYGSYKDYVVFPLSLFKEGYSYSIPLQASFNDATAIESIEITRQKQNEDVKNCNSSAVMLIVALAAFAFSKF